LPGLMTARGAAAAVVSGGGRIGRGAAAGGVDRGAAGRDVDGNRATDSAMCRSTVPRSYRRHPRGTRGTDRVRIHRHGDPSFEAQTTVYPDPTPSSGSARKPTPAPFCPRSPRRSRPSISPGSRRWRPRLHELEVSTNCPLRLSLLDWPWIRTPITQSEPRGRALISRRSDVSSSTPRPCFVLGDLLRFALTNDTRRELDSDDHLLVDGVKEMVLAGATP